MGRRGRGRTWRVGEARFVGRARMRRIEDSEERVQATSKFEPVESLAESQAENTVIRSASRTVANFAPRMDMPDQREHSDHGDSTIDIPWKRNISYRDLFNLPCCIYPCTPRLKLPFDRLAHAFRKVLRRIPHQLHYSCGTNCSMLTSTLLPFNPAIEIRPSRVR